MQQGSGSDFSWRDVEYTAPICQVLSALERLSSLHPLSIFARKRLDISFFPDVSRAIRLSLEAMLLPGRADGVAREQASLEVSRSWLPTRFERLVESYATPFPLVGTNQGGVPRISIYGGAYVHTPATTGASPWRAAVRLQLRTCS